MFLVSHVQRSVINIAHSNQGLSVEHFYVTRISETPLVIAEINEP